MATKLVLLGAGANSIEILDVVTSINEKSESDQYECIGFLDSDEAKWGLAFGGRKVLGPLLDWSKYRDCCFLNGIGSPSSYLQKEETLRRLSIPLERFATIVHPCASVSRTACLGRGTVVFQHVTVGSDVRIGNHVLILPNSVLGHGDVIGDYTCIASSVCVSGNVTVGRSCYLGAASSLISGISVGDKSLVGIGSVAIRNVDPNVVVAGNPARLLRKAQQPAK